MGIETTIISRKNLSYQDTYAALPTANLQVGELAYATDLQVVCRWDGTTWQPITNPLIFYELVGDEAHQNTNPDAWEDWDISAIVPSGAKYALIQATNMNAASKLFGVRKNGSALERKSLLAPGGTGTFVVELDAGCIIELFSQTVAANGLFGVLGYWLGYNYVYDMLLPEQLKAGRFLIVPTPYGWTEVNVGDGNAVPLVTYNYVGIGGAMAANSSSLLYTDVRGLSPFNSNEELINWAKKLRLQFGVIRQYSDAEVVARVQLKQANTIGALAAKGIGLKILNYALWGESYGTELGEVDLGVTLISRYLVDVLIAHDPSVPKIEWYVDTGSGMVLRGTQATSAKIPQTVSTDIGHIVHSIANGATGGIAVYCGMNTPVLWQER